MFHTFRYSQFICEAVFLQAEPSFSLSGRDRAVIITEEFRLLLAISLLQALHYVQTAQHSPRVIHVGLGILDVVRSHVVCRSGLFA
jgi:hypothetical protein